MKATNQRATGQTPASWQLLASGQAGYAREKDTDWRFIWGVRVQLNFRFTDHVRIYGEYRRQESPTYIRNDYILGFTIQL